MIDICLVVGNDDSQAGHLQWLHAIDSGRFHFRISQMASTIEQALQLSRVDPPQVWLVRSHGEVRPAALGALCRDDRNGLMPVVMMCRNDLRDVSRAMSARVAGVTLVNDSLWNLTSAIHAAAARRLFVSPQVLDQFRDEVIDLIAAPVSGRITSLTDREHEVLLYLAEGESNAKIARRLHVSQATVGSHVLNILRKLDVSNRTEAAVAAIQSGMLRRTRGRRRLRSGPET